uniref:Uncharacterized protein n=1 Tax=Globodera rostochiensis TaxID=31243 RepID=A0A914H131_GLORO
MRNLGFARVELLLEFDELEQCKDKTYNCFCDYFYGIGRTTGLCCDDDTECHCCATVRLGEWQTHCRTAGQGLKDSAWRAGAWRAGSCRAVPAEGQGLLEGRGLEGRGPGGPER